MAVTELVTFTLLSPFSEPISEFLSKASTRQAAWSRYPLLWYEDVHQPSTVYLISGWKDVDTHMEWIASDENQKLVGVLKSYFGIDGMVHLDIDPAQVLQKHELLCVQRYSESAPSDPSITVNGETLKPIWVGFGKDVDLSSHSFYTFMAFDQGDQYKIMQSVRLENTMVMRFKDIPQEA